MSPANPAYMSLPCDSTDLCLEDNKDAWDAKLTLLNSYLHNVLHQPILLPSVIKASSVIIIAEEDTVSLSCSMTENWQFLVAPKILWGQTKTVSAPADQSSISG